MVANNEDWKREEVVAWRGSEDKPHQPAEVSEGIPGEVSGREKTQGRTVQNAKTERTYCMLYGFTMFRIWLAIYTVIFNNSILKNN